MRIGVLGVNHKTSELALRERLAKGCQKKLSCETEIAERLRIVILSTCNRIEIYFCAEDLAAAHSELLSTLREEIDGAFEHQLYTYFGMDCFLHLALVTAGLDSVVLAETEIQRQVKVAYQQTLLDYPLSKEIHFLFQKCLKIGKEIRSNASVPIGQTSLPGMVYQLGQAFFQEIETCKILMIGNSEINRKVIAFFSAKGVRSISLCTRSLKSAEELKTQYPLEPIAWSEMHRWTEYDLIICGTNVPDYLICQLEKERVSTQLIIDLSVPRNVDPQLARHPQITLFNMEQLGQMIEQKQQRDEAAIEKVQGLISHRVQRQIDLFHEHEIKGLLHCH